MTRRRPPVLVAGFDATPTPETEELLELLTVLREARIEIEVLLVGDGERLAELRKLAPVTVANGFRWRGLAALTSLARADRLTRALKGRRLRRWLRARATAPCWVVQDPRAASFLRYAPRPPRRLIAGLPMERRLDDVAIADLGALRAADGWIVRKPSQGADLAALGADDVVVIEALRRRPGPVEIADPSTRPVRLVPTPNAWTSINHTIEIADHLVRHHPGVPIEWVTAGPEDAWLARHDLDRAGVADGVRCTTAAGATSPPRLIVHTGYSSEPPEAFRFGLEQIPVLAFAADAGADGPSTVAPLAVDDLLARIDATLRDPELARTAEALVEAERRERALVAADAGRLVGLVSGVRPPAQASTRSVRRAP